MNSPNQEGARPAQGKKKDGKQNLEMPHTEPVTGVEPVARKSKGKKTRMNEGSSGSTKKKRSPLIRSVRRPNKSGISSGLRTKESMRR
jgi:hypothetical protein